MPRPLVIAHRGASEGAVDNSLEAFAGAIEVGADMLELDVRRTRDDRLVCFHDARAGGRPLHALTHEELAAATGHRPPLLDEVVELAAGRIGLDVELKEDGHVDRVLRAVAGRFDPGRLVVTSFLDEVVRQVARDRRDVRAGLLVGRLRPSPYLRTRLSELLPVRRATACGAAVVGLHADLARLGALARTHAAGLDAYVWTVNHDAALRRWLGDPRVAGVITDVPARALELAGRA